jgi:hypothetical protein
MSRRADTVVDDASPDAVVEDMAARPAAGVSKDAIFEDGFDRTGAGQEDERLGILCTTVDGFLAIDVELSSVSGGKRDL